MGPRGFMYTLLETAYDFSHFLGMATAATSSNCPLCTDQYNMPTKLPICGHVFCRACLMTYACVYKDDDEIMDGLKCPTCGVDNDKPKNVDNTETWIGTLSTEMVTAENKPSSSQEVECASCKSLGRSEKAVKYCLNCMECLCQLCLNICHTLKPMRHHKFIDIGNTCDQSDDDINLLRKMSSLAACSSHPNETIKFHCLDDDTFCCTICIVADHRKCSKVLEIEKQIVEEKFKGEMAHMKDSVSTVLRSATEVMEQMQSRIEAKNKQTTSIAETITEMRVKINKVLDDFESKCNETAKALILNDTLKIQDQIGRLKSEIESFETHVSVTAKADESSSSSHQYITRIRLRENLKQFEIFLEEMTNNFHSINVSLKQEKLLDELISLDKNDTAKLGSVIETPDKPLSSKYNAKTKLESYHFNKIGEKEVKENYSSGMPTYSSETFLSNNHLVLLDSKNDSGHCLLASEAGKVLSSCDLVSCGASSNKKPYCVTVTKPGGTIAVSLPEQKICFVTANNGQLKVTNKIIQTKYEPGAICGLKNGDIAVAWKDPVAFGLVDVNKAIVDKVYFCQDKAGRTLKSFDFMAVDEERSHVIQPCTTDKAVYCFDFNGNPKFKYTNPELKDPRGVALGRDGNIYVCNYDFYASCIHVISPTGSASRLIKDGCPRCSLAIAFNKDGDSFVVSEDLRCRYITFFNVQRT